MIICLIFDNEAPHWEDGLVAFMEYYGMIRNSPFISYVTSLLGEN